MPKRGLEPPRTCVHMTLNHARLPIPPLRQRREKYRSFRAVLQRQISPHQQNILGLRAVKEGYWLDDSPMRQVSKATRATWTSALPPHVDAAVCFAAAVEEFFGFASFAVAFDLGSLDGQCLCLARLPPLSARLSSYLHLTQAINAPLSSSVPLSGSRNPCGLPI